jgi:hypothetical protein
MKPGIYPGTSMAEYLALNAVSASSLEVFRRSPEHYRTRTEKAPTAAMLLGSAVHMGLLEPDLFAATYVVADPCGRELASGARKGQPCGNPGKYRRGSLWLCGQHAPDEHDTPPDVVAHDERAAMDGMIAAIHAHPRASTLFRGTGGVEVTVVWEDPETGLLCKARPDRLIRRAGMLVELKTTGDASHRAFAAHAARLGYHLGAAHYRRGLRVLHKAGVMDYAVTASAIVAVESDAPHVVGCYLIDERDIERAEVDVVRSLHHMAACRDANEWPGYGPEFRTLRFPGWAFDTEDGGQDDE